AGFAVYGGTRLLRPLPISARPVSGEAFRSETRALYAEWLLAVFGPPALGLASAVSGELLGSRGASMEGIVGPWAVLGVFFTTVLLVRAVVRVRRAVDPHLEPLRRAVVFLPVA